MFLTSWTISYYDIELRTLSIASHQLGISGGDNMPPKGKKGQASDNQKAGDDDRDEPLQAVVGLTVFRTFNGHSEVMER